MKLFYCYSGKFKNYLLENGEKYITKSIHEKTGKKYWVFVGNDKLNNLLSEWRLRRKTT